MLEATCKKNEGYHTLDQNREATFGRRKGMKWWAKTLYLNIINKKPATIREAQDHLLKLK